MNSKRFTQKQNDTYLDHSCRKSVVINDVPDNLFSIHQKLVLCPTKTPTFFIVLLSYLKNGLLVGIEIQKPVSQAVLLHPAFTIRKELSQ
ncbi:hypothetical protein [Deinococcus misasensis]|uniref:hypothetical protein n=1 Tax=Deinococcus misasensis TaxID=392413 RepID=UPI0012F975A4|nr:hypothetical protein [Deinococcus misasensis]